MLGADRFNEISAGAPGLSRALLSKRLRELGRAGVIEILPKPDGPGSLYRPTEAGRQAQRVLEALGAWGDRWTEVLDENSDSGVVLWLWAQEYVRRDQLPSRRVTLRFDHRNQHGRAVTDWLLIDNGEMEFCRFDPGFGDDVVVTIEDRRTFARWHLGLIEWSTALRAGVHVSGDRELRRAFPSWNAAPERFRERRARWAADG